MFAYVRVCSEFGVVRTVMVVHRSAASCYWEIQLEIGRRRVMVGARWNWVADGGAVF